MLEKDVAHLRLYGTPIFVVLRDYIKRLKQVSMVVAIMSTHTGSVIQSDLVNMEKRIETLKWSEKTPNCHMVVHNPLKLGIKSMREVLVCFHQASND